MKTNAYLIVFFLVLIAFIGIIGIRELGSSADFNNLKITENINQGNIILHSQDFSKVDDVPSNIFIGKIENNNSIDNKSPTISGGDNSKVFFDSNSKELVYATTRRLSQDPNNSPSSTIGLSNGSSVTSVNAVNERLRKESLYICGLTPMYKCTYELSMDINTDDAQGYVELYSPGSKLIVRKTDNNSMLRSYFQDASGNLKSKTISIGNADKLNIEIIFDGENKTNTIVAADGNYITTPFYKLSRQNSPYIDISNGYIRFLSFINGNGTYLNLRFSSIKQKAERKFITPIGDNKIIAFGFDGPSPRNLTGQGINYLNSKGDRGTLWFDVRCIAACNQSDLEYLRNLVSNDSWEVGIHLSTELDGLTDADAYHIIDTECQYVYETIGKKPTSWCSLRNSDSIIHAIYAYNKHGMYWRNGDSGVSAEELIGNLDDDTWHWWEPASRAGMTHPVFTHQTDSYPAIKYSISPSKFKSWVDNCYSNNVSIVPFYEYSLINRNTHDAYFDNISSDENLTKFEAHTNGFRSLINVNLKAENNPQVYDTTIDKYLDFKVETDKSITFWVENNHTYYLYPSVSG